jgi:hypothetical protein
LYITDLLLDYTVFAQKSIAPLFHGCRRRVNPRGVPVIKRIERFLLWMSSKAAKGLTALTPEADCSLLQSFVCNRLITK